MTWHQGAFARASAAPLLNSIQFNSMGFVLVAAQDLHHPVLRCQLELADSLFFHFLFGAEMLLGSEFFEFVFERLMLLEERSKLAVTV
jgi:hypothetical protein